ncbi:MAG: helix-turn-helix domain-containing protein [Verrucomicrobiota bacterium]
MRFQEAFRASTGLPLRLVSSNSDFCLDPGIENQNAFCEELNNCTTACDACVEVNRKLMQEAEAKGPTTCHCFTGMCATAVPVRLGKATIAFLKTGQVFSAKPSEEDFEKTMGRISRSVQSEEALERLRLTYFQTKVLDPNRYASMITLLETMAELLSRLARDLSVTLEDSDPEVVRKAKQWIFEHLADPIPLDSVAKAAGVSPSHFSRIFRSATGQTLTAFVANARIEWAKKELLKPGARISEIALDVGFQSLSQFNRSFAKHEGCSPRDYRKSVAAAQVATT